MARFRLRFLLQEFDLHGPEVVVGRSPDCHVTIEDPLMSRRHARFHIEPNRAIIEDLGSRNGVRINGELIDGPAVLRDGDRLRLGTQELVFFVVKGKDRSTRPTAFMRVCAGCRTPYPDESPQCPHCGATEVRDDDTISGLAVEPLRSWTFDLLGQVIERALSTGRSGEADRLMRRAAKELDELLAEGQAIEEADVALLSQFAIRLARLGGSEEWISWALGLHRRQVLLPAPEVLDQLEELDMARLPDVASVIASFAMWYRHTGRPQQPSERVSLERLERLAR